MYAEAKPQPQFYDKSAYSSAEEYHKALDESCTVYVGNLEQSASEEQLYALFRCCGDIRRIIVGLNAARNTPCGFAFIEFYHRRAAELAVALNGTAPSCANKHARGKDGRPQPAVISVDRDTGFAAGRQYSRRRVGPYYQSDGSAGTGTGEWQRRFGGVKRNREDVGVASVELPPAQVPRPAEEIKTEEPAPAPAQAPEATAPATVPEAVPETQAEVPQTKDEPVA